MTTKRKPRVVTLKTLAKGDGSLSVRQLAQIQQWIDDDWESHDIDRDAVRLIQRLLRTARTSRCCTCTDQTPTPGEFCLACGGIIQGEGQE